MIVYHPHGRGMLSRACGVSPMNSFNSDATHCPQMHGQVLERNCVGGPDCVSETVPFSASTLQH